MKMIRNFWVSPVPGPQDRQRHEGDDRHVADEVDERLDRRLPGAVAPIRTPIGSAIAVEIRKPMMIR